MSFDELQYSSDMLLNRTKLGFMAFLYDICFFCEFFSLNCRVSFTSARQHPSYGDCLEVKREYY